MSRLAAIRTDVLSLDEVIAAVSRPEAGAIATFAGLVRNHADGLPVTRLEYEAYPSMAEKEMAHILESIEAQWPDVKLAVLHRTGTLDVGDIAVVCAASAPHRDEAFRACRQCIDRIKETVPIWKREHGPDGPYWVGWRDARCAHDAESDHHHSHGANAESAGTHDHHHHDDAGTQHAPASRHPDAGPQRTRGDSPLTNLGVAILTVSDSRTAANDESGQSARRWLAEAGAQIAVTGMVPDEPGMIAAWVAEHARPNSTHAVIVTGGTGIAARDQTIEALSPLFSRTLDGFGEAFRRLSFDQIGPRAVLSRAVAGVVGSCLVFALPGSPKAVDLALRELIIPLLPHAAALLREPSGHHHTDHSHER